MKMCFASRSVQGLSWSLSCVQWSEILIYNKTSVEKSHYCAAGHERSSTASKTSDEKFKLTKTLFSVTSALSSKHTLSWRIKLLSDVGLMTIMRGTLWGDLVYTDLISLKFKESKESLRRRPRMQPFSSLTSEMSLVRLWLRLLVRTSRGRVATVRELETSSCSQVLNDSFMADGCFKKKKERKKNHKCIRTK